MTTEETILTDTSRASVDDAIASAMGDVYDCLRVWSAWSYGTMGPDDFSLVAEDSDRLWEISDAAIRAVLQSPEIQEALKDKQRLDVLEKQHFQPIDGGIRTAIDEQIAIDAFMGKLI